MEYKSISGTDYLIEIPIKDAGKVPASWTVISRVKALCLTSPVPRLPLAPVFLSGRRSANQGKLQV